MKPTTKQRLLFTVLAGTVLLAIIVFGQRAEPTLQADPPLSAAALTAIPDDQLMHAAATELRWSMAGDVLRQSDWRDLNEPARTVLALSWVENGNAHARMDSFNGFGTLLSLNAPNRPTADDLACAYDIIGAPEMGVICREAQRISEHDLPTATDVHTYAELDEKFRRIRSEVGTSAKIQTYIRQHAPEIAAVRNH